MHDIVFLKLNTFNIFIKINLESHGILQPIPPHKKIRFNQDFKPKRYDVTECVTHGVN